MPLQLRAMFSLKRVHRVECEIFAELFVSAHLVFGIPILVASSTTEQE